MYVVFKEQEFISLREYLGLSQVSPNIFGGVYVAHLFWFSALKIKYF
jgi:hypothetical protein